MKFVVEARLRNPSSNASDVKERLEKFLEGRRIQEHKNFTAFMFDAFLNANLITVRICETIDVPEQGFVIHMYCILKDNNAEVDMNLVNEEGVSMFREFPLPDEDFEGIWESLIIDNTIMTQLLKYVDLSKLLIHRQVDSNLVAWNHVVLFHGPPGNRLMY
jgi:pachytene checkpoint protein 2